MSRIRSTHPGQWTDENFVACTSFARLLALSLRNIADDRGVFPWKPITLKMQLFPADNVDIPSLLDELVKTNQIQQYEVNGHSYGIIRNFEKWQNPRFPKYLYPEPPQSEHSSNLSSQDDNDDDCLTETNSPDCGNENSLTQPITTDRGKASAEGEERRGEESKGEEFKKKNNNLSVITKKENLDNLNLDDSPPDEPPPELLDDPNPPPDNPPPQPKAQAVPKAASRPTAEPEPDKPPPRLPNETPAKPKRQQRGERMDPEDPYFPPSKVFDECVEILGSIKFVEQEIPKFCDHFISKSGDRAVISDWNAAFRNWCRNALEISKNRRKAYA